MEIQLILPLFISLSLGIVLGFGLRRYHGFFTEVINVKKKFYFYPSSLFNHQSFLKNIFEQAEIGIAQLTLDGTFLAANSKFYQLVGYNQDELSQLSCCTITHPDFIESDRVALDQLLEGKVSSFKQEKAYIHQNGTKVWCQVTISLIKNEQGQPQYLIAIIVDLGERKRAEEERDRFFSLSLDMLCISGFDGYFKQINAAFEKNLGHSPRELLKQPFIEFVHPDDRATTLEELNHVTKGKQTFHFENRYRCQSGDYRWFAWTATPYAQEKLIYAVAHDITDIKRTEIALYQQKEQFRIIFEVSPTGIAIANLNGEFVRVNPAFCQMLEYSPEELLSLGCDAVSHSDDRTAELPLYRQLIKGEISYYRFEKRYCTKTGKILYGILNATLIRNSQGNPSQVLGQVVDISERKQTEVALQESETRLNHIVNTISDGLLVVDEIGKIQFVNPAAIALFEQKPEDLRDYLLGIPLTDGKTTEIYLRSRRRTLTIAEMRVSPISWRQKPAHLVSLRDITEQYYIVRSLKQSEEKYRQIVETTTEGIWLIDRHHCTTFVNQQMATMLGYEVKEMIGKSFFDFMDEPNQVSARQHLENATQNKQETHDFCFQRRDSSPLWAIVSSQTLLSKEGNYQGRLKMITDITERKQFEQALAASEQRLDSILRSIQDVVWSADAKTFQMFYINEATISVYGRSPQDFLDDSNLWFSIIHGDDQQKVQHNIEMLLKMGSSELEYRIIRPDKEIRWLYTRARVTYDEQGNPLRLDGIDSDITDRHHAEEQLRYHSTHDGLTHLPNRVLFMDRLEQALQRYQRHRGNSFAVLVLDIDEFKVINDSLGHMMGDDLLKAIAHRLQKQLSPSDTLARLGGDEFALILEEVSDVKVAIQQVRQIHHVFTHPFVINQQNVFTNASIGITLSNPDYQRVEEILRDADTAMYRAKASGKADYAVFDHQMHQKVVTRLQLETDLRHALEHQEFQVYYQPIINLQQGNLSGFEALIRWQHPEKGLVSPAAFIPVAEETGLIIPIGEWILYQACQQLQSWQLRYPDKQDLKVSVNLSGKQLRDSHLISKIDEFIAETAINPQNLKLEITESMLMENVSMVNQILQELKKRKIVICLDDFGTGYSSLSYLHRFAVDTLKIDRSFIMRMQPNDENAEIIRAIVTLAHILGMDVIAEGVETTLQLTQLRWLNCEYGQGYFFAKPLPANEAEALIHQTWQ